MIGSLWIVFRHNYDQASLEPPLFNGQYCFFSLSLWLVASAGRNGSHLSQVTLGFFYSLRALVGVCHAGVEAASVHVSRLTILLQNKKENFNGILFMSALMRDYICSCQYKPTHASIVFLFSFFFLQFLFCF